MHLHDVKLDGPVGQGSVVEGNMDQNSQSDGPMPRGSGCTMLMSPWRQSVTAPAKHTRRQKQSAESAIDAGIGALQVCCRAESHGTAACSVEFACYSPSFFKIRSRID